MGKNTQICVCKSIDLVFKNLELFGKKLNISKKKLSYLDINDILNIYYNLSSENLVKSLKNKIRNNLQDYNVNKIIQLPDVIINPKDIYLQDLRENSPNFITNNITKGEIKKINVSDKKFDLTNKIVCIENADPGFDFIFSHKIKGQLQNMGFNYMSIRCSELNTPAAIGVGDEIFESLYNKNRLELNCENKNNFDMIIGIIPAVKEKFKNQLEPSIEPKLLSFIKSLHPKSKIKILMKKRNLII